MRSKHHTNDKQRVCCEVSDPDFDCEGRKCGFDAARGTLCCVPPMIGLDSWNITTGCVKMMSHGDATSRGVLELDSQRGTLSNFNIQLPLLESPRCHHCASPTFYHFLGGIVPSCHGGSGKKYLLLVVESDLAFLLKRRQV